MMMIIKPINTINILILIGILNIVTASSLLSHDNIPAARPLRPVFLSNAKIFTGSPAASQTMKIIERGSILIENGKIAAIGESLSAPKGAEVIDCNGKTIFPGFIAPISTLGLIEVEALRPTRDQSESGVLKPNAKASTEIGRAHV